MEEKNIAKPPVNILFNPNLVAKKNIWEIDLVSILDTLINILEERGKKDLRVCGIAALSSAIILRLKVESIFALERIANQKKPVRDTSIMNNINMLQMPYRFEAKYPVSLEDLLSVLESMLENLSKPKEKFDLEPLDSKELDQYLVTFEELLEEYKDDIYKRVTLTGKLSFNEFTRYMDPLDATRYFIAILYLAMENKVELEELEDDILIIITNKTLY
jgi:segregation and condensation protein A